MTRLEALQALAEKVEAGADTEHDHAAAFPSESAYGHCTWHDSHKAAGGSLDAAKALHEAVLPEWVLGEFMWWRDCCRVALMEIDHNGRHGGRYARGTAGAENADPARAWLLAILKALIAQEQAKGDE